jgi:putative transcriptional regulator
VIAERESRITEREKQMAKLSERELLARDAKRDLGAELLASVKEMKAGKAGHVHRISVSTITEARARTGLSQPLFAGVLGVSTRTLQEWEQGRRNPSGAARTLLMIAHRRPEAIIEVMSLEEEKPAKQLRLRKPALAR